MKIVLTINERFGIRNLLNEVYSKGGLGLDTLKPAQKIIEAVNVEIEFEKKPSKDGSFKAIKGDEAVEVNMRQVLSVSEGKQVGQLVWDSGKDKGKELDLSKNEVDLLLEVIKNKSEKKELGIGDAFIVGLNEKLNK